MLAIVFACEKAHNYVFGRDVTIHTDHKPLQSIFNKAISQAPARLQRMLLRVSQYNLTVKYVGANKVLVADTLSRLIDTKQPKEIPGLDVTIAQVLKIEPTRLDYLQDATKSDNELTDLSKLITEGWPDSLQDVPEHLRPYWSFRDELTIMNGLVLKGNRVVIPRSDRHNTLARLHDSHHQETKLLQRARRSIYWPNMDDDVRATCFECEKCQVHGPKLKRAPERQLSAARPMELLGMDLSEETRLEAFIAVDFYSGYLFFEQLRSKDAPAVIKTVRNVFQHFGLAEKVITDNGSAFKSAEFNSFLHKLEIRRIPSSPHFHQSNGRAERAVQTIKQILRKCEQGKAADEVLAAITAYHYTPIDDHLPTPAELFLNRRINTCLTASLLPTLPATTKLSDEEKEKLAQRRAQHLKPQSIEKTFIPDEPVWYTEDKSKTWSPGFIDAKDIHPRSYWVINQYNNKIRRNIADLKPRYPRLQSKLIKTNQDQPHDNYLDKLEDAPLDTSDDTANPVRPATEHPIVEDATPAAAATGPTDTTPAVVRRSNRVRQAPVRYGDGVSY